MRTHEWHWRHTAVVALFCGMAIACFGCGTAGGKALGACELGKLPSETQTVIPDVMAIAMAGGSNWQSQLESLGMALAPGQLDCIVQAIAAAWMGRGARLEPERVAALGRLGIWLQAHKPKACTNRPRG